MRGIFISYRRDDSEGQAGRLFDDLSSHFGRDAVFMDVANIKKGLDFRRSIDEHVSSCGVLLVIIGRNWLGAADAAGKRRLDDGNDFVRLETAAALKRDIPVVPVLVQGAKMPIEQDLPEGLKDLAFRNGTELTHARWDSDVKLLIEDIKPYLDLGQDAAGPAAATPATATASGDASAPSPRSKWLGAIVAAVVLAVGGAGYVAWQSRQEQQAAIRAEQQRQQALDAQRARDAAAAEKAAAEKAAAAERAAAAKAAADKAAADKAAADRLAAEKAAADKAAADAAARQRQRDAAAAAAAKAEEDRAAAQRREQAEAQRAAEEKLARDQRAREEAAVAAARRAEEERRRNAAAAGTCLPGYVWREAAPGDRVCVTPATREQTAADNRQAAARREPGGGPYGPNTCRQGYVWREAFRGDLVCVTPDVRSAAAADNARGPSRVAR